MKVKFKGLKTIFAGYSIFIVFFFAAITLAEDCPSGYPYDCGDEWCCGFKALCYLPSDIKEEICYEKEIECPIEDLYGESSSEVVMLRYYRDTVLKQTPAGREIIRLYYTWSPSILMAMAADDNFKQEVKETIDSFVEIISGSAE